MMRIKLPFGCSTTKSNNDQSNGPMTPKKNNRKTPKNLPARTNILGKGRISHLPLDYAATTKECPPTYKVETTKSGRSTCNTCKKEIVKGTLRVGVLNKTTETYCHWMELNC